MAKRRKKTAAIARAAAATTTATTGEANTAPTGDVGKASRPFKVRATRDGYYDNERRREGNVFTVTAAGFSPRWMERVSPETPESKTTGQEEINRKHDEVLGEALKRKAGGDNPLGAE